MGSGIGYHADPMALGPPELWIRNPRDCIRECVEVGMSSLVWDAGFIRKSKIDPWKFSHLYYGVSQPWRSLVIDEDKAVLIDEEHNMKSPVEVFPVWRYGQKIDHLETLMAIQDFVVVTDLPAVGTGHGRQLMRTLDEIQVDHPEHIMHIHGVYSFRTLFGMNFRSVDCEPRTTAQKGRVYLPTGKEVSYESTLGEPHWVHLLGMRPVDLRVPRNRCMYNIRAMEWATKHFKDAHKIETRNKGAATDPNDPNAKPPTGRSIFVRHIKPSEGDKIVCNLCTLQTACKFFREGGVCIVPGSEPVELARFFQTRNADDIIDGLGTLLAAQTRRLQTAMEKEEDTGEMNPEVRKIIEGLFDRGVKLAKLLDPALAASGAARINLTVGGTTNNTQINAATPQALMAAIVDEFAKRGIPRDQITGEMVMKVFNAPEDLKQKALEQAMVEKTA